LFLADQHFRKANKIFSKKKEQTKQDSKNLLHSLLNVMI